MTQGEFNKNGDVVNFIQKNGSIERIEARYNAVVINYFEDFDCEGERYLRPFVSVECIDWNLKDELLDKAREIISKGLA